MISRDYKKEDIFHLISQQPKLLIFHLLQDHLFSFPNVKLKITSKGYTSSQD